MFYENELQFLRDVFAKSRVRTSLVSEEEIFPESVASRLKESLENSPSYRVVSQKPEESLSHKTVYKLRDSLGLCYVYFFLPGKDVKSVFLVGPYHSAPPSRAWLLSLGEKHGISPKQQKYFEEYLLGIPEIAEGSPLFLMLDRFCEMIWESPSFAIVELEKQDSFPPSPIGETLSEDVIDDVLVNVKAIETRYAFENQMIQAVSKGQLQMENQLAIAFSDEIFEKRISDPIRNAKNYGIIMNTLLRKAAEGGGVHPMYIDRVSSDFAAKIENASSATEIGVLMREMFRVYCRLVRKHALNNLSSAVQKAVIIIDSDLSADLSPSLLAQRLNISLGYLCTIFKREIGKTVSEYVREKRLHHAKHLLSTTNLQIQTVALHCGIMDVQYFSKIFKKETGKTPKEYRESARHTRQL